MYLSLNISNKFIYIIWWKNNHMFWTQSFSVLQRMSCVGYKWSQKVKLIPVVFFLSSWNLYPYYDSFNTVPIICRRYACKINWKMHLNTKNCTVTLSLSLGSDPQQTHHSLGSTKSVDLGVFYVVLLTSDLQSYLGIIMKFISFHVVLTLKIKSLGSHAM